MQYDFTREDMEDEFENILGMRSEMIPHIAIPSVDIRESIIFYEEIGAKLGRWTDEWAIFNFQGTQLVCHLVDEVPEPTMYPRHFGIIISDRFMFDVLYNFYIVKYVRMFKQKFSRHTGTPAEHETFFLQDPSNNVIEFKWYRNPESIFGRESDKAK